MGIMNHELGRCTWLRRTRGRMGWTARNLLLVRKYRNLFNLREAWYRVKITYVSETCIVCNTSFMYVVVLKKDFCSCWRLIEDTSSSLRRKLCYLWPAIWLPRYLLHPYLALQSWIEFATSLKSLCTPYDLWLFLGELLYQAWWRLFGHVRVAINEGTVFLKHKESTKDPSGFLTFGCGLKQINRVFDPLFAHRYPIAPDNHRYCDKDGNQNCK